MSKHPIPDWLRSQFSRIEDEVQKLGPCGVFTQMRTVTQTYFEQQAEAPQPPALGGELVILMVSFEDHKVGQAALLEHIEVLKKQLQESTAHLAPLQAEIVGLKKERSFLVTRNDEIHTRTAELEGLLSEVANEPFLNPSRRKRIDAALSKPAGSEQV